MDTQNAAPAVQAEAVNAAPTSAVPNVFLKAMAEGGEYRCLHDTLWQFLSISGKLECLCTLTRILDDLVFDSEIELSDTARELAKTLPDFTVGTHVPVTTEEALVFKAAARRCDYLTKLRDELNAEIDAREQAAAQEAA
jgi:hypothetical protein